MHRAKAITAITGVGLLLVAGLAYLGVSIARRGFSARETPSRLEKFVARYVRTIAIPETANELKNPYAVTAESLSAARAHWVAQCAICHALDGSGDTIVGRNLYPKPPDMRGPFTQGRSDGQLFYTISNGIRFTGMPAWGSEHSPEETWQLVSFIRRLPQLTPEELKLMGRLSEEASPNAHSHAHVAGERSHESHKDAE